MNEQLRCEPVDVCAEAEVVSPPPTGLELNAEQTEAVSHYEGPALIPAGAGTGKTRVIVKRIERLASAGVEPTRILAVTFGQKAAREMNMRLGSLVGRGARVGTFHSLAFQIVREEWGETEFGCWRVDDANKYRTCVKEALGYRHMNWRNADLTTVEGFIGWCKANAAQPNTDRALDVARMRRDGCDPQLLAQAYFEAEEIRRQRYLLTYDDMLVEAWLLLNDEGVRQRWAGRWDFVLQDEAQDENYVQRQIVERLARDHRNYFVVGDPAQSIYGFRGSDPRGLLAFADVWNAKVIRLSANYRSGRRILDLANRVVDLMEPGSHLGVRIDARRDLDGLVTATRYAAFDDEGAGVVKQILERHVDGRAWRDCAVLYRTNAQSRSIEEALLAERVPYFVVGSTNFYDRKEVKDLLAYLRVAAGLGTIEDLRRAINTPFRFLGKAFLDAVERASAEADDGRGWTTIVRDVVRDGHGLQQRQRTSALEWCGLIDQLTSSIVESRVENIDPSTRPAALLERLIDEVDYNAWLSRDEGSESPENNRISNTRELVRAAERFPTVDALLEYIYDTLRKAAEQRRAGGDGADCVILSTIHRAKGLEWPCVFVLGVNDKILPHARCVDDAEELRLWYVAVTRARDELHVSCVCRAAVGARMLALSPSRFVLGVGLDLVDHGSCRDIAIQNVEERQ